MLQSLCSNSKGKVEIIRNKVYTTYLHTLVATDQKMARLCFRSLSRTFNIQKNTVLQRYKLSNNFISVSSTFAMLGCFSIISVTIFDQCSKFHSVLDIPSLKFKSVLIIYTYLEGNH